jgi:tRNA uridine 5-carboxymethylaminomethyl modification enzyme
LTEKGRIAGIVGDKRWNHFKNEIGEMEGLKTLLLSAKRSPSGWIEKGFRVHQDTERRSAFDLLRLLGVTVDSLADHIPAIRTYSPKARTRVGIEGVYAPYVERQKAAMRVFQKDENLKLPQTSTIARSTGSLWKNDICWR